MSRESIHVEIPSDQTDPNPGQDKETNNDEAAKLLDQSICERLDPTNNAGKTMKDVKGPEKSNVEVKIEMEQVKDKVRSQCSIFEKLFDELKLICSKHQPDLPTNKRFQCESVFNRLEKKRRRFSIWRIFFVFVTSDFHHILSDFKKFFSL